MVLNEGDVRSTARVLETNRNTVSAQFKKSSQLVHVNPLQVNKGLELSLKADENRWLWWGEDAVTGKLIAFVFVRRTHQTFRHLLSLLEQAKIQVSRWITDSWWAYSDCLEQRLRLIRKVSLQSLELKLLTLRTRLKHRTICLSKSTMVHDTTISLFINQLFLLINVTKTLP